MLDFGAQKRHGTSQSHSWFLVFVALKCAVARHARGLIYLENDVTYRQK
jgi:hypothetical protein